MDSVNTALKGVAGILSIQLASYIEVAATVQTALQLVIAVLTISLLIKKNKGHGKKKD